MSHRYNLRPRDTTINTSINAITQTNKDTKINLSIEPSWNYGISTFNSKNTFIALDKNVNDKYYTFEVDRKDTLGNIHAKILKDIIITPKGILKDNLNITFIRKQYKKPDNYEIKGEISHMKDYPVKGFNGFFNEDVLHKTIDHYLQEGDTSITLYYHISGSFVTENMCIIS
jgi:hypothetical protein